MIRATKIKMELGCYNSIKPEEIDEIYLTGAQEDGWYSKEDIHDFVKKGGIVKVNRAPYPELIAEISKNNEKYVRSNPDSSVQDNLLSLPKE